MPPQKCLDCGLVCHDQKGNGYCVAFKRNLSNEDLKRGWDCYYFIAIINDDGEQLTPFEHYLLKMDEIEKMKVSVMSMAFQ